MPTQLIRWKVGYLHVSESDSAVENLVDNILEPNRFTPGCIANAKKLALKIHHNNQDFFRKMRF